MAIYLITRYIEDEFNEVTEMVLGYAEDYLQAIHLVDKLSLQLIMERLDYMDHSINFGQRFEKEGRTWNDDGTECKVADHWYDFRTGKEIIDDSILTVVCATKVDLLRSPLVDDIDL